jgi:hypothetical protein
MKFDDEMTVGRRFSQHAAPSSAPVTAMVAVSALLGLSGCYSQNGQFRQALLGTSNGPPAVAGRVLELSRTSEVFAGDSFQRSLQSLPRGAQVSLDDAYQAAFGVSVYSTDVDQRSGAVAGPHPAFPIIQSAGHQRSVADANLALGQIEHRYGLFDARYTLCGLAVTRDQRSYLLLSVVLRRWESDSCEEASPPNQATDTVLDWAVIERRQFDDDKTYAFMLAASVRAIVEHRRAPDYWDAAKQWQAGQISSVLSLSEQRAHAAPPAALRATS